MPKTIKLTPLERESCRKGRKVQILLLLEKTVRMTSTQLYDAMHLASANLTKYTHRLRDNGLITIYDESKFKRVEDRNYRFHYHSITDAGRELISNLGR